MFCVYNSESIFQIVVIYYKYWSNEIRVVCFVRFCKRTTNAMCYCVSMYKFRSQMQ